ncbi:hypothetical protein SEA_VERITY_68 [Gordonia phage Verity]|uniref:Uncharacterized protein n=1 Tax=Gordonia phage Verity TaxID=2591211 RepID=A0A514DIY4_9CAUD|nr:hypothetical protein J1776_gp68 [Gordonia phage Verity]QDH93554.1 hypothetical protein SEA_VERITY_68 [Gordonia phage Verity]QPO16911.1 hypothetical protein SEA_DELREY21_68 [Gordonia phage Delrey21]QXN74194.1 hypothetical protein SEA_DOCTORFROGGO_68 [Gordonia phage DoctorFroggo]
MPDYTLIAADGSDTPTLLRVDRGKLISGWAEYRLDGTRIREKLGEPPADLTLITDASAKAVANALGTALMQGRKDRRTIRELESETQRRAVETARADGKVEALEDQIAGLRVDIDRHIEQRHTDLEQFMRESVDMRTRNTELIMAATQAERRHTHDLTQARANNDEWQAKAGEHDELLGELRKTLGVASNDELLESADALARLAAVVANVRDSIGAHTAQLDGVQFAKCDSHGRTHADEVVDAQRALIERITSLLGLEGDPSGTDIVEALAREQRMIEAIARVIDLPADAKVDDITAHVSIVVGRLDEAQQRIAQLEAANTALQAEVADDPRAVELQQIHDQAARAADALGIESLPSMTAARVTTVVDAIVARTKSSGVTVTDIQDARPSAYAAAQAAADRETLPGTTRRDFADLAVGRLAIALETQQFVPIMGTPTEVIRYQLGEIAGSTPPIPEIDHVLANALALQKLAQGCLNGEFKALVDEWQQK